MPDHLGAVWSPNSNHFYGRIAAPRWVILHGTAGGSSAENIAAYFASTQGTDNPVSSHYVIGVDGVIVQCVSEQNAAYANGGFTPGHDGWWNTSINPNQTTISIEHCKPSTSNMDALTPAQIKASFVLVKDICQRWNIPMRAADGAGGITGHFSLDPIDRKDCPGPYPWGDLWQYLKGAKKMLDLTDPTVAQFFTDDGAGNWKCKKNGVVLIGGILGFYRNNGGPALLGLPLQGEMHTTEYPHTAIVPCERAVLVYDPQRIIDNPPLQGDVYLAHLSNPVIEKILGVQAILTTQTPNNPTQAPTPSETAALLAVQQQLNAAEQKLTNIQAIITGK